MQVYVIIDKYCTIVVKELKLTFLNYNSEMLTLTLSLLWYIGWTCVMGALIFDECTCVYCTRTFYFMTRANVTDTPVAKGLMYKFVDKCGHVCCGLNLNYLTHVLMYGWGRSLSAL